MKSGAFVDLELREVPGLGSDLGSVRLRSHVVWPWRFLCLALCVALICIAFGCGKGGRDKKATGEDSDELIVVADDSQSKPMGVDLDAIPSDVPIIGAKGLFVMVRDRPDFKGAAKLGYLRLGGMAERSVEQVPGTGCKGGWYRVEPNGYACVDEDATLDRDHPVMRAASRRPDLSKPMPYAYGFVRAVLPMYLRVPTEKEQFDSEFQLKEHLAWWEKEGKGINATLPLGANDVFVDAMGVPDDSRRVLKLSTAMGDGERFGGSSDSDPIPWWLDGGRKIPNVAEFKVPEASVFADRSRRFSGLTFVGSFPTGPKSLNRRFAITEDLRLAPTSKLKPDSGPTFHGVEISEQLPLPIAWIKDREAKLYKIEGTTVRAYKQRPEYRSVVKLTGKKQYNDKRLYYETDKGRWVRSRDIAIATTPSEYPAAAKKGEKWIDISIRQQVLILFEGKVAVYATLVSTGQDMLGDPKTTKSTVLGTFRIESKHATTHMDSNEGLTRESGDPEYGKTKRRGQGTFLLQHVPWVQYFKSSYALHATYWHDVFGTARSHGCINLTPIDAHRVFFWTTPSLPKGWHGVYPAKPDDGTVVYVHE
ncbi:MAG: L,D-transpeptidase [Polyangiaceae bacterium]|nr:L,D-transpeptidase [Polyangiaceae bacterium]